MKNIYVFIEIALSFVKTICALPLLNKHAVVSRNFEAPQILDNPSNVVYRADFPFFNSPSVTGLVQFYSLNGTTKVHIDLTGLPKNMGFFSYHIHENSIPYSTPDIFNACESVGLHFNPYKAPLAKDVDCDTFENDAKCQVGDLSGKHGVINTTCYETYYYDPYISLNPKNSAFIGGKSLVIHIGDSVKLACANIVLSNEPEDLVLFEPSFESVEGINGFGDDYGDDFQFYDLEINDIKKKKKRFNYLKQLDWGFLKKGEQNDTAEDVDFPNFMNHSLELFPAPSNLTPDNSTSNNSSKTNLKNFTLPLSGNGASNHMQNLHLWGTIRIALFAMIMILF